MYFLTNEQIFFSSGLCQALSLSLTSLRYMTDGNNNFQLLLVFDSVSVGHHVSSFFLCLLSELIMYGIFQLAF